MQFTGIKIKFFYKGQYQYGTIVKTNPTRAKVDVQGKIYNVPYELLHNEDDVVEAPVQRPTNRNTNNYNFNVGDKVIFGRTNGKKHTGIVMKVNSKTFLVKEDGNGTQWRVPGSLLNIVG